MENKLIFVTGYFGSPINAKAAQLAEAGGFALIHLDDEIKKRDGRSVQRICMTMGEHAYRNSEYELLEEIARDPGAFSDGCRGLVVACGDGVLHDDMSADIIRGGSLVITGMDMDEDQLWRSASGLGPSYHAFMNFGSEEDRRAGFHKLYERQKLLFSRFSQEADI